MTDSTPPSLVNKHSVVPAVWREVCQSWTLASASSLHVMQEWMPPHTRELTHLHSSTRQFYFVLEGTATVLIAGSRLLVEVGDGIEIGPGSVHQMRNESDRSIEFLVISSQRVRRLFRSQNWGVVSG